MRRDEGRGEGRDGKMRRRGERRSGVKEEEKEEVGGGGVKEEEEEVEKDGKRVKTAMLPIHTAQRQIRDLYQKKYGKDIPDVIQTSLERLAREALKECDVVGLYKFAEEKKDQKLVKITSSSVPASILKCGCSFTLHDIKVDGGHGPDDEIYNTNSDIRQKIPRGLTLLQVTGKECSWDTVIYANKKFTGGIYDEDEHQPDSDTLWKEYFIGEVETTKEVIGMNKMNGEAGHFSARFIDGDLFIISGSKNVHLMTRKKEDIELYEGDRYNIAKIVTRCVWDVLESMALPNRDTLYSLLHHTRTTVVCEILQPTYQHIVDLSHLNKPQLVVLSLTSAATDLESRSLTAMPPHHTVDLFEAFGFTCPSYTKIPVSELPQHKENIRCELHKEGEVLYFLNQKDETIGLVKSKTLWYILSRALREKAVFCFGSAMKNKTWELDRHIEAIHKRYIDIQSWLKFPDCYLNGWKKLAEVFLHWTKSELQKSLKAEEIRPQFPFIWRKFLKETNSTDNIPLFE